MTREEIGAAISKEMQASGLINIVETFPENDGSLYVNGQMPDDGGTVIIHFAPFELAITDPELQASMVEQRVANAVASIAATREAQRAATDLAAEVQKIAAQDAADFAARQQAADERKKQIDEAWARLIALQAQ